MHMITLQALFALYLEEFLKNLPELRQCLQYLSREVSNACMEGKKERIERAHQHLVDANNSSKVIEKMAEFDAANNSNPLFVVMRHYMRMVMEMFAFIKSVRNGDRKLHLIALQLCLEDWSVLNSMKAQEQSFSDCSRACKTSCRSKVHSRSVSENSTTASQPFCCYLSTQGERWTSIDHNG